MTKQGSRPSPLSLATLRRGQIPLAFVLISLVLVTALPVWFMLVLPVLAGIHQPFHQGHHLALVLHASGGSLMLFAGLSAIILALKRRPLHRHAGRLYLVGGGAGALLGLGLALGNVHGNAAISMASGVLALAWLAVAAMAWRAAINRQYQSHRDWMVRSYVLTWTFVACRIAMNSPIAGLIDTASIIWTSWIVPLVVCEICLQWRSGSRKKVPG